MNDAQKFVLTVEEIKQLAEFAGLKVEHFMPSDELETEIAITNCPTRGIKDPDNDSIMLYKHIAYFEEYPEEGVYPLGKPTPIKS